MANRIAFILIGVTLVFATLAYGGVHQPALAVIYILVGATALLVLADAFLSGQFRIDRSPLQLTLFLAALYAFLQVIPFGSYTAGGVEIPRTISLDPFATEVVGLHFVVLGIFFSTLLIVLNYRERLKTAVIVLTGFGAIYAFYAILQGVLSPDKIYGVYGNAYLSPFGSFVNRNNFAAFIEMAMCLPLGMLITGAIDRDKKLVVITAIGLMGVALLLSSSRGGFVSTLAAVLFIFAIAKTPKEKGRPLITSILAVALALTIIVGAFFVGGETSLSRFSETGVNELSATSRTYIWGVTLKVIAANMPFGAGLGAFGVAFTPFDSFGGALRVEQAHNDFLQVAADAGVPGILIGAFFVFGLFKAGMRGLAVRDKFKYGVSVGSLAGCLAMLVHSVFDFGLHTTAVSLLFLTLVGFLIVSGAKART